MREKRLDCEEMLAEERRNSEALKKELEALQKKARIIDSSLKTAQNDLEAFQASQENGHDDDDDEDDNSNNNNYDDNNDDDGNNNIKKNKIIMTDR